MTTSVSITIFIVLLSIAILAVYLKRCFFIDKICSNYIEHVSVLLDRECNLTPSSLNRDEKRKILLLHIEDWKRWHNLELEVKAIADKYKDIFDQYVIEQFPDITNREYFKNKSKTFNSNIGGLYIESMKMDELELILTESNESWKNRKQNYSEAAKIKKLNPNGFTRYCRQTKNSMPSSVDIIRDKISIVRYQKSYEQSKIYTNWSDRQDEFCNNYYKWCNNIRPNDGLYKYQINCNQLTDLGVLKKSTFNVWQGFVNSFCKVNDEIQPQFMIGNRSNLPNIKTQDRYFVEDVYNSIFDIITSITSFFDSKPLVVFIDYSRYNWNMSTYEYHYKSLKNILRNYDYKFCNFSNLDDISKTDEFNSVFIFDLITDIDDLKISCGMITEYFTKKIPCVCYYSLIKEYTEEEILKAYKKEEPQEIISQEDLDIKYIKSLFGKVKLHPFFKYIAITNVLIGRGVGSKETKRIWLSNPERYLFRTTETPNYVSGEYSTNGGISFKEINILGSVYSIDDVVKFSYQLFKSMDIWDEFKSKGSDAINHMNEQAFLATH